MDAIAAQKSSTDMAPIVARSNGVDRTKAVPPNMKTKSRQTNHVEILAQVDGRLALARRFKDIINAIIIDAGGADQCSESKVQLIRRFTPEHFAQISARRRSVKATPEQRERMRDGCERRRETAWLQNVGRRRRAEEASP